MFFNFVPDTQPKPNLSTPLPTSLSQSSASSSYTASQSTPPSSLNSSFSSLSNTPTLPSTTTTTSTTTLVPTSSDTLSAPLSSTMTSSTHPTPTPMTTTVVPTTTTNAMSLSSSMSTNITPSLTLLSSSSSSSCSSPSPALTHSNPQAGWLHLSPSLCNMVTPPISSTTTSSPFSSTSSTHPSLSNASSTCIPSSSLPSFSSSCSSSSSSSSLHMELERLDSLLLPLFKRSTRDVVNTVQKDTELPYLNHSDVVPGEYEGGLKVWECSLDLSNFLISHSLDILTTLQSTNPGPIHILELGCGTALPTIAFLLSLSHHHQLSSIHSVTFHDFNIFVLRHMTYPNVLCNFAPCSLNFPDSSPFLAEFDTSHSDVDNLPCSTHYAFGEWGLLPFFLPKQSYSLIFTSETVYKEEKLDQFIDVLEYALALHGMAFIAAKTFYFGVGGGLRSFEQRLLDRGSKLISEVMKVIEPTLGSGVPREILKLTWNPKIIAECH